MDFGRPNVEIGWKMANGELLFLVLTWNTTYIIYMNFMATIS